MRGEDPNGDHWIASTKRHVLTEAGGSIDDPSIDIQFAQIVRRGLLEIAKRRIDRYEDRHDRPFLDKLFDPNTKPRMTFRQLKDVYVEEKSEDYKINGVSKKRLDKITAIADCLCEIIGETTPVADIDDDHVQRARSMLAKCPSNCLKIYPDLSLEEAIERAAKDKKPTLSSITQSVYLDVLRDILKVGERKKLIVGNPAAGVRPLKKDTVSADQKRLPLTDEQLNGFFCGKFYKSCAPGAPKPYDRPDRAWRFWLPLIMLFAGARPNEIAQLHVADVRQTAKGTWYLDCNESDEDGKSLKTQNSKRRVPLHPELIRIGFLAFVEERRKCVEENGPRLFYELKPNEYGNFAWYAAKRLNETFIPAEIGLSERQSLYSLRHNVRDALRRVKAPDETLAAVTGWAPNGKAVSSDYGDPGNPDFHAEWVEKIAYEGLDLSFLHCESTAKADASAS
jgi:integrase